MSVFDACLETIAVALAGAGVRGDVREYGKVANTPSAVKDLATKLSRVGNALRFCYEAGPCGYGIQRQLTLAGHGCVVVAPSLIPRKPGRSDPDRPAGCDQPPPSCIAPERLASIWVPDPAHEAIHYDLTYARTHVLRPSAVCVRPVSSSLAFSCVMAVTTIGRRGH